MYWANMQGNLKGSEHLKPRDYQAKDIEGDERRDKIKEKKKHKSSNTAAYAGVGVAAGVGIGAGVVLAAGGLALVANPNNADYNDPTMMDKIADGFHDGLSALTDISFGDMIDAGEGVMEGFEDIDWPDIDFDGFADMAGELFGDAGEFFADAGEGIAHGVGEAADAIGDVFDF